MRSTHPITNTIVSHRPGVSSIVKWRDQNAADLAQSLEEMPMKVLLTRIGGVAALAAGAAFLLATIVYQAGTMMGF